jgi:hypothetical protein
MYFSKLRASLELDIGTFVEELIVRVFIVVNHRNALSLMHHLVSITYNLHTYLPLYVCGIHLVLGLLKSEGVGFEEGRILHLWILNEIILELEGKSRLRIPKFRLYLLRIVESADWYFTTLQFLR